MEKSFPFKLTLFTNNHILDKSDLKIGKEILIDYFQKSFFSSSYQKVSKSIIINEKRKTFTNKELDYTCIELFDSDEIKDFLEIELEVYNNYNTKIHVFYFELYKHIS